MGLAETAKVSLYSLARVEKGSSNSPEVRSRLCFLAALKFADAFFTGLLDTHSEVTYPYIPVLE